MDIVLSDKPKVVLKYAKMDEQCGGIYNLDSYTLLGTEDGEDVSEYGLFVSDEEALGIFIDNCADEGALGFGVAIDVTESEDFRGWGRVISCTNPGYYGEPGIALYSVTTEEYDPDKHSSPPID